MLPEMGQRASRLTLGEVAVAMQEAAGRQREKTTLR